MLKEVFKEKIKKLRIEKGIYQQDFADKIGVSKSTVAMWETGKRMPDLETTIKIADFFECSVDYLLERTDTKSVNEDIQTACKVTGLSEELIIELNKIKNENDSEFGLKLFSDFLTYMHYEYGCYNEHTTYLSQLINMLCSYFDYKLKSTKRKEIKEPKSNNEIEEYKKAIKILYKYDEIPASQISPPIKHWICYLAKSNFEIAFTRSIDYMIYEEEFKDKTFSDEEIKNMPEYLFDQWEFYTNQNEYLLKKAEKEENK